MAPPCVEMRERGAEFLVACEELLRALLGLLSLDGRFDLVHACVDAFAFGPKRVATLRSFAPPLQRAQFPAYAGLSLGKEPFERGAPFRAAGAFAAGTHASVLGERFEKRCIARDARVLKPAQWKKMRLRDAAVAAVRVDPPRERGVAFEQREGGIALLGRASPGDESGQRRAGSRGRRSIRQPCGDGSPRILGRGEFLERGDDGLALDQNDVAEARDELDVNLQPLADAEPIARTKRESQYAVAAPGANLQKNRPAQRAGKRANEAGLDRDARLFRLDGQQRWRAEDVHAQGRRGAVLPKDDGDAPVVEEPDVANLSSGEPFFDLVPEPANQICVRDHAR